MLSAGMTATVQIDPQPQPQATAAIFALLLAFLTGLVALYAWLEPAYGVFQAFGRVLAVIAFASIGAAMFIGRRRTSSRRH